MDTQERRIVIILLSVSNTLPKTCFARRSYLAARLHSTLGRAEIQWSLVMNFFNLTIATIAKWYITFRLSLVSSTCTWTCHGITGYSVYEFYGNIFEKRTFEKKLLAKSANHGPHMSAMIGNTARYSGGQNSFIKFTISLSENKNWHIGQCVPVKTHVRL